MIFRVTKIEVEGTLASWSYVCTLELVEKEYKDLHIQHAEPWVVCFPEPLLIGQEIDLSRVGRWERAGARPSQT